MATSAALHRMLAHLGYALSSTVMFGFHWHVRKTEANCKSFAKSRSFFMENPSTHHANDKEKIPIRHQSHASSSQMELFRISLTLGERLSLHAKADVEWKFLTLWNYLRNSKSCLNGNTN